MLKIVDQIGIFIEKMNGDTFKSEPWRDISVDDRTRSLLKMSGCYNVSDINLDHYDEVEKEIIDGHDDMGDCYISSKFYGGKVFITNFSEFADDCSYSCIYRIYHVDGIEHEVPYAFKITCNHDKEEAVIKTLKHGRDYFFRPWPLKEKI